ncbi:MAG TPA: secondary thiamine-phosphate synthase enzyme YjbQ [Myxococcales bacterium LLY-WYZ-16_1]|jgi:secondary thiamine-phosphate synthase enzyme|nr:secondary thiamine-phosphate synthase enzyme YjbQ [Myxococcales bacterium LLY-WYZ-16_1]
MRRRIHVRTEGRGFYDITDAVRDVVREASVQEGLAQVFIRHTSASLVLNENADPQVRRDLERFMADLVPDGDRRFMHREEGPDDMPAHVRAVLTLPSVGIPVAGGQLDLGTWQGLYLWEHRTRGHDRELDVLVLPV